MHVQGITPENHSVTVIKHTSQCYVNCEDSLWKPILYVNLIVTSLFARGCIQRAASAVLVTIKTGRRRTNIHTTSWEEY